jgi:hypothetical protein
MSEVEVCDNRLHVCSSAVKQFDAMQEREAVEERLQSKTMTELLKATLRLSSPWFNAPILAPLRSAIVVCKLG